MGMHFVNSALETAGILDATRPEIVIYGPLPNGRLRLIGADYLVLADAWNATHSAPPQLMGSALSSLRESQPLRTSGVLHTACVGLEGESHRCVRELALERVVQCIQRASPLNGYRNQGR